MMIPWFQFWQFIGLLATHWIADFVCQTHWQAVNKSKHNGALARHVGTYTLILSGATFLLFAFGPLHATLRAIITFILLNGALHFATDYFTSRWSSRLYAKQDWHNFFVVIGFDQLIHQGTLAATMWWLLVWRI